MNIVTQLAFAYVAGLAVGGIIASLMELSAGEEPSFAPPFFSRDHLARFLISIVAAGPFMLANDALRARRSGELAATELTWLLATASIWAVAVGTAVIGVVKGIAGVQ